MITVEQIVDAALFSALHSDAFTEGWSVDACRDVLAMPGTRCWIAGDKEGPAGFLVIRQAADEGEVITTGVVPPARRNGIARKLFRQATSDLEGCNRLFLEVSTANGPAISLYESLGFIGAGRRRAYYADRTDALVMVRQDIS